MSELKRYYLSVETLDDIYEEECKDGEWCKYEDVEKLNRWISVSEQLPENEKPVIAISDDIQGMAVYNHRVKEWYFAHGVRTIFYSVTHWQPLLPKPK